MVIAFIPVRGGSKSIPLKNIKPLCGKPLVCWNIEALEACPKVNQIIVATDSDQIERTVNERRYTKTTVYRRNPQNASDTATTESAMLEYIQAAKLPPDTTFMLVQATSPMTQTAHFTEALEQYAREECDSLLTCVRTYRFYWSPDGTPLNYDYRRRPRRQNFNGTLMENGAFYINTVANILASGNRLTGRIAVYEMPPYTAAEIDEPDDWTLIEQLMQRHILNNQPPHKPNIRLFISDIDGTLTDGSMYYSEQGDELKKFNTRDGVAFNLLRQAGIKTALITGEDRRLNERRAQKLRIDFIRQAQSPQGKLQAAQQLCQETNIPMTQTAYIGDDLNCIPLLQAAALKACPADAAPQVKAIPNIITLSRKGGDACVREFIQNFILK